MRFIASYNMISCNIFCGDHQKFLSKECSNFEIFVMKFSFPCSQLIIFHVY